MLSDREREKLSEIERSLSGEDPKLAETLAGAPWPSRARHHHVRTVLMVVAALLAVVALVLGHMTGAIACALVAGWTWGARQRRTTPGIHRSRATD
ncbi:DUF3040 domain-containing protein [Lentzea flaviverrucosa]|uniref:DUF3040 domain-containing protein n=1 Tax=Lentzea flaviverrucosa TaxID=200379 RepID=A0A1H9H9R8_9PSEU|nr:DUF3040 domain-containing protein [Lentzea flaviverrucosa]RDI34662.1 DUF3040 family protein [Lentzea flaviverrucosa]SEQ58978.1 Protein of unknown function [Lentzea flaviverrucosa]